MKPTKNKVFCRDCNRPKMLFPSEEKALNFIKFNSEEIAEESEKVPVRAYFCDFCNGWHVTSSETYSWKGKSKAEQLIEKSNLKADKNVLAQATGQLRRIEELLAKGNQLNIKGECKALINYIQKNAEVLSHFPQTKDITARLTRCVEVYSEYESLKKTIGYETESLIKKAEAAYALEKYDEVLELILKISPLINKLKIEPNAIPAQVEDLGNRFRILKAASKEAEKRKEANELLIKFEAEIIKANEAFEKGAWISAKDNFEHAQRHYHRIINKGLETLSIDPEIDHKIEVCKLYIGISNISAKLEAADRLLAKNPTDGTARYFIEDAQKTLIEICNIEGENAIKLDLLDKLEVLAKRPK